MKWKLPLTTVLVISSLLLAGCGSLPQSSSQSLALRDMLSPARDSLATTDKKPLHMPARVAILMIPPARGWQRGVPETTLARAADQLKHQLEQSPKYVSQVSIVTPEDKQAHMPLQQLAAIYAADVVIALSYQQDQRSEQNSLAALLDLSIVTDFVVPSVKNTTTTYVEGKIIHAPSDAIIFRITGTDERTSWSTRYTAMESRSPNDSMAGFMAATQDFGNKLTATLADFDHYDMSQAAPLDADLAVTGKGQGSVARATSAGGGDNWGQVDNYKRSGGALDPAELAVLLVLGGVAWRRGRAA